MTLATQANFTVSLTAMCRPESAHLSFMNKVMSRFADMHHCLKKNKTGFIQKMKAMATALKGGFQVKKHRRRRWPRDALVFLSPNGLDLRWAKASNVWKTMDGTISVLNPEKFRGAIAVADIRVLMNGARTKNFGSYSNKEHCISIVAKQRSVDLEFKNAQECDRFASLIEDLMVYRLILEDATLEHFKAVLEILFKPETGKAIATSSGLRGRRRSASESRGADVTLPRPELSSSGECRRRSISLDGADKQLLDAPSKSSPPVPMPYCRMRGVRWRYPLCDIIPFDDEQESYASDSSEDDDYASDAIDEEDEESGDDGDNLSSLRSFPPSPHWCLTRMLLEDKGEAGADVSRNDGESHSLVLSVKQNDVVGNEDVDQ